MKKSHTLARPEFIMATIFLNKIYFWHNIL